MSRRRGSIDRSSVNESSLTPTSLFFILKNESKKYRIADDYHNHKLKPYTINNSRFIDRICHDPNSEEVKHQYHYLIKWFDDLTCDMEQKELLLINEYNKHAVRKGHSPLSG